MNTQTQNQQDLTYLTNVLDPTTLGELIVYHEYWDEGETLGDWLDRRIRELLIPVLEAEVEDFGDLDNPW